MISKSATISPSSHFHRRGGLSKTCTNISNFILKEDLAVIPGSPADKAGLMENDIILKIDGEKLTEKVSLTKIINKKSVGDTVTLTLLHKGEEIPE